MKGNPMKRNFGIGGTPMAMKNVSPLKQEVDPETQQFIDDNPPSEGGTYTGNVEGEVIPQDIIKRADKIEADLEKMNISKQEALTAYNNMKTRVDEFLTKAGLTWNEETETWEGLYNSEAAKETGDRGMQKLKDLIAAYNEINDDANELIRQINQALVVDHPAAVSDSTHQATDITWE